MLDRKSASWPWRAKRRLCSSSIDTPWVGAFVVGWNDDNIEPDFVQPFAPSVRLGYNRSIVTLGEGMVLVDGSAGEGGGQVLRTALALSVLTGQAMEVQTPVLRRLATQRFVS